MIDTKPNRAILPPSLGMETLPNRRDLLRYSCALPIAGLPLAAWGQSSGRYYSTPKTEWLRNQDGMILLEDFKYRDPRGRMWKAPKGARINGASIPRIAWTLAGSPYQVPYRDASIIHDVYCDSMARPWEDTHRVFYDAMITSSTSQSEALIKYWAVVRGGPRWDSRYRWSGLWPFKSPRDDRPYHGPPPPPPPPPTVEESAANARAEAERERLLAEEFAIVRADVEAGRLRVADVPSLVEDQIAKQPSDR